MKELIKKLLCLHDWEIISKDKYTDVIFLVLVCKKCGKVKKLEY